jgi:hypothetical protein
MLSEFVLERGNQLAGLLVDGTLAAEMIIVFGDGEHALAGNVSSAQNIFEEWDYIFGRFGTTEGDYKNRVVVH